MGHLEDLEDLGLKTSVSVLGIRPKKQQQQPQPKNWLMFQTGEKMGDVDLNICLKMGDLPNATQLLMQKRRALAVPHLAIVEIVLLTANVLDARTSGGLVSWGAIRWKFGILGLSLG